MLNRVFNKGSIRIVDAENGKHLVLKNNPDSEKLIGRPIRIILQNGENIPEFEEV